MFQKVIIPFIAVSSSAFSALLALYWLQNMLNTKISNIYSPFYLQVMFIH